MRRRNIVAGLLLFVFAFTVVFLPGPDEKAADAGEKMNGANIVYYWKGDWDNVAPVLNRLKSDGFNQIAICIIWYQKTKDSVTIREDENMSPPDEKIVYLIEEAHKRGMGVMLRPYVNIEEGNSWEGQIDFGNNSSLWGRWFESYERFVLHYAKIAQEEDVELFSVGAELEGTVNETGHWEKVIKDVRKVYNGKILYAANWGNEENVKFFDKLDYISLDFYPTLSEKKNPSESDFENALRNECIPQLRSLYLKYKKPIILSETGFRSIDSAYTDPWDYEKKGKTDYEMQAELYKAILNTLYKEDFIKGIFLWYAPPSLTEYTEDFDKYYKNDYAFFDKPAEEVIKRVFLSSETGETVNPLLSVNSAAACYSENESYIRDLTSHLDLIVLQTRFLDPKFVSSVSEKTLVAGYVSILEFDGEKTDFEKYKLKDAVIGNNNNWDSPIMNINNKNYRNYVIRQIRDVFDSGAQGVFLDTIDDVENFPELKKGTIEFVKMLHQKFPDKFFIMNRGFAILDDVADDIQGALFEDFGTYYNFDKKRYEVFSEKDLDWINKMALKLRKYQDRGKIRVFASGYAPSQFSPLVLFSELLARKYGFVFYASDIWIEDVYLHFRYPFPRVIRVFAE
ncbi:MAG: endo alpha-1,4 polygalactosaminidase [Caldisericaceae bacterium]|nr:endo alpha-1,4 polygalactosaminidase [Caldisericaceae bacterium]